MNSPSFSTLMFLRHRISASDSLKIMDDWLKQHPEESQKTLAHIFKSGEVIYKNSKEYIPIMHSYIQTKKFKVNRILIIFDYE